MIKRIEQINEYGDGQTPVPRMKLNQYPMGAVPGIGDQVDDHVKRNWLKYLIGAGLLGRSAHGKYSAYQKQMSQLDQMRTNHNTLTQAMKDGKVDSVIKTLQPQYGGFGSVKDKQALAQHLIDTHGQQIQNQQYNVYNASNKYNKSMFGRVANAMGVTDTNTSGLTPEQALQVRQNSYNAGIPNYYNVDASDLAAQQQAAQLQQQKSAQAAAAQTMATQAQQPEPVAAPTVTPTPPQPNVPNAQPQVDPTSVTPAATAVPTPQIPEPALVVPTPTPTPTPEPTFGGSDLINSLANGKQPTPAAVPTPVPASAAPTSSLSRQFRADPTPIKPPAQTGPTSSLSRQFRANPTPRPKPGKQPNTTRPWINRESIDSLVFTGLNNMMEEDDYDYDTDHEQSHPKHGLKILGAALGGLLAAGAVHNVARAHQRNADAFKSQGNHSKWQEHQAKANVMNSIDVLGRAKKVFLGSKTKPTESTK